MKQFLFIITTMSLNKEYNIRFSENLNQLLKEENVSLSRLSRMTNINKSTLHNYLNGVLPQGLMAIIKISHVFKIPIEDLIFKPNSKDQHNHSKSTEVRYEIIIKELER